MELKKLLIKNFKGLKNFELSTNGMGVTNIWGDNATGKTTIFDSFTWLLFGKDSLNSAIFDIKPLDESGEAAHGLEHEVEALLSFGDKEMSLKKVYVEKMTKKRGSPKRELTGHTTNHWIDGVPIKKGPYQAAINSICDEDIFKLLTSPRYFNEILHWQDRRKLLLEVCGDISDEDVISSDESLSELPDILGKRKLEDHRKVIASRRVEINRELEKVPVRIDEVESSRISEVRNIKKVKDELAAQYHVLQQGQGMLSEIEAGGGVAVLTTQIREIDNKISEIDNQVAGKELKVQQDRNKEKARLNEAMLDAGGDVLAATRKYENLVSDQNESVATIKTFKQDIVKHREFWHKEDTATFKYEDSGDTCPTCGQSLPKEKIEAARAKALEQFNEAKAQKLVEITGEGKAKAVNLSLDKTRLAEIGTQMVTANTEIKECQKKSIEATEAVEQFKNVVKETENADTPPNPERESLVLKRLEIEKKISEKKEGSGEAVAKCQAEIAKIEDRIEELQKEELQIEANTRIDVRITELKGQERKLSAEYEKLEKELYLTEQFIRTKVAMLEDKINSKFKIAQWKLFDEQINEGLKECCVVTVDGVPYPSMNNAARIQSGIDIIKTLSEHYDKILPIWLDNAEAVTNIPDTKAQQIRLVVSLKDKTLRIG